MNAIELKKDFYWIGVLDPDLKTFDIIIDTEFGTSYNSYLIKGSEKTVIFETSKLEFADEYIKQLDNLVGIDNIDYIILSHTEPDHSGAVEKILDLNPKIKLVGTAIALKFIKEIVNRDFKSITIFDGDALSLGDKTLKFITAPNLHWPDVMWTFIPEYKSLISCDAFGAHFCMDNVLYSKISNKDGYEKSVKFYFDSIMSHFKPFVLKATAKIENLEIEMICPGHGPVLDENPMEVVNLYNEWSKVINPNTKKTVVMPYVSAYGYTKMIGDEIAKGIKASGDINVKSFDMDESNESAVLKEIFWADGLLLGTPTMVGEALKPIWDIVTKMIAVEYGGKIASAYGSYGWSGEGVPNIIGRLKQLKMKIYKEGIKIPFKPSEDQLKEAYDFGIGFGKSILSGEIIDESEDKSKIKEWRCTVCGQIVKGEFPPAVCPVCGVGPEKFEEVK